MSSSPVDDGRALDWLDKLLAVDDAQRAASLAALAGSNPEMHARLQRLLASALSPEHSRALAGPVVDELTRIADSTRVLAPGDVLAGYRLIRELGRGGMSVVWLAERADGVVKRNVALKMPLFMMHGVDLERFTRERDALAALSHPHVARIYDAGVLPSGQPFIVLEHVDGAPLTEFCDARRLDLRARIRLFLQVLAAVEHAHKHLVVHRDLKPSNILVDGDGHARLLDFGIAKLLGEDESAPQLTREAGGAMTPLYAAPEQIHGATISTLTDVFALGVVLHELLTGALPYAAARAGQRASIVDILETLRRGELPRASQAALDATAAQARGVSATRLRQELDGDLDTIVSKALRVAPEDRYASAAHLADDLRRWLDHQPIAARRPSFWYATRLALRRHRVAAGVAGVGVVLVAGAGGVAWSQYRESRAHEQRTAAVRGFMIDFVSDAEAIEGHEGEVTGRQMVDGAVQRARREFANQPQLRGELLSGLGHMYMRLESTDAAIPVLVESIGLLERAAAPDDPALNKTRVYLAGALLATSDDLPRVRKLAAAARDACADGSVDCTKARAYASSILSQVASYEGDDDQALVEMRRSAHETEEAFGARDPETVVTLTSLATIARNAGRLVEAETAMRRAVEIGRDVQLFARDRVELERTMAVIDHDLGHYAAARDRLVGLIASTSSPAERVLQRRVLTNVYVELGDWQNALQTADEALTALGEDPESYELPFVRQARARALALAGRDSEALGEIDAVIARLVQMGRAAESFEVLRARRYRAEFLLRAGRHDAALAELRELSARHESGSVSPVERGLVLDLLGEAERREGRSADAVAAHESARAVLTAQLPAGHPFLVRNATLRGVEP